MKDDVVFIIFDSLCQHNIGTGFSGVSTTPYLDSIRSDSYSGSKVYSQGPYTEAGTKALLCGEDTLSGGGYLLRYASARSFITDEFYNNGYETYCYMYPSALLSGDTIQKTDHMIYTSGFDFAPIWTQKFSFYLNRFENGTFDQTDMQQCVNVMKVVFVSWSAFLNPKDENEAYRLIRDYTGNYDFTLNRQLLKAEMESFDADAESYIDSLFRQKKSHSLFRIGEVDMKQMINSEAITSAFDAEPAFEPMFRHLQLSLNRKNNRYSLRKTLRDILRFCRTRDKYDLGKIYSYYSILRESKAIRTCRTNNTFKTIRSCEAILDDAALVLREKTEKPKFVFIHTEDTHYFSTFFSYDSNDVGAIRDELRYAQDYLEQVGTQYRGNLMYDMSIRYVDRAFGKFMHSAEESYGSDHLTVCATADHGYSYNCYPLRSRLVNNFHEENYHIPFFLFTNGRLQGEYPHPMLSKDLLMTLYDWCALKVSSSVTGVSSLNRAAKRSFVMTEYMGPGCPDLRNREAWLSARSSERMVAVRISLSAPELTEANVAEAYDLIEDPLEEKRLTSLDDACLELLEQIRARWLELKTENNYS